MNAQIIVETENLCFNYNSAFEIKNINFNISKGEIFGLLGISGSGKSTIINLLTKELSNFHGTINIFNQKVEKLSYVDIGILTDSTQLYGNLSILQNIEFIYGIRNKEKKNFDDLLTKLGIYEARHKKISECSKGTKQRAKLASIIFNAPKILFLDEPTDGLDPLMKKKIHDVLLELKKQGTSIFLTTHDMLEADYLCDRAAFIKNGRIIDSGDLNYLKEKYNPYSNQIKVSFANGFEQILYRDELQELLYSESIDNLQSINTLEPTLNEIFLKVMEKKSDVA